MSLTDRQLELLERAEKQIEISFSDIERKIKQVDSALTFENLDSKQVTKLLDIMGMDTFQTYEQQDNVWHRDWEGNVVKGTRFVGDMKEEVYVAYKRGL